MIKSSCATVVGGLEYTYVNTGHTITRTATNVFKYAGLTDPAAVPKIEFQAGRWLVQPFNRGDTCKFLVIFFNALAHGTLINPEHESEVRDLLNQLMATMTHIRFAGSADVNKWGALRSEKWLQVGGGKLPDLPDLAKIAGF